MFKQNYLTSYFLKNKFDKKISFDIKNKFYFYEGELIIIIPSLNENRQRFILMLILMEKLINNKLCFLFDTKTLSRDKPIKIGCVLNINKEMLYLFLSNYIVHNIPKLFNENLVLNFNNSNLIKFELNKILSNIIFNFDKDLTFFYDYLNDFDYKITFFLKSIFNNIFLNKLLFSFFGIHFLNNKNYIIDNLLQELDNNNIILLDSLNDNYEVSEFDYINTNVELLFTENILNLNYKII
jgi:hypothetical protein